MVSAVVSRQPPAQTDIQRPCPGCMTGPALGLSHCGACLRSKSAPGECGHIAHTVGAPIWPAVLSTSSSRAAAQQIWAKRVVR